VTVFDPNLGPATESVKQNIQMVKAGINYRFNTMGGPGGW
jgi:hypothetical protein